MSKGKGKPFVALACLCEKVLSEKDKVLSLVRVIDIFYIPQEPKDLPESPKPGILFYVVVSLRCVDLSGTYKFSVKIRRPDGTTGSLLEPQDVKVDQPLRNINMIFQMGTAITPLGLYFIDVLWNGRKLTSIPFRLLDESERPATDPQVSTN